jgi:glycosyltransferase involved in cell wall biosynthesis
LGEAAFLSVKTCAVSEHVFTPLPGLAKPYSAIYNAQLVAWKRHDLSLAVDRCAFIFYRAGYGSSSAEEERDLIKRHGEHAPGHRFVNHFDADGVPVRMPPDEVNLHLNSAHVGLCLSETEGAMYASVEYMLAGLAVASTPNRGGRDHFFDDDFCLTVDADAEDVRRGVQELISRRLDPDEINRRTLEKLQAERSRFTQLLNDIRTESGSHERFSTAEVFGHGVLLQWMPHGEAARQVVPS